jgi:WD40 repeat protein
MPVYTTRFSDDGTHVVSADTGGTVRVWNLADGSSTAIEDHGGVVYDARLSADGRQVVTGGDDRVVRVWDLESGDVISLSGHKGTVWSTEFSADGRLVMSSGEDAVKVWDWRKQIVDLSLSLPGGSYRAALSPDGRRIASTRTQDPRLFVSECETCGSIDDVLGMADERTTRELSSTEQRNFATDASR